MKDTSKLKEALLAKRSAVIVNRLFRLMERFATPDAFFAAPKGTLEKQYRELNPDAPRDLGRGFYECFDEALAMWNGGMAELGKSELPDPLFTREDLKKVLDFMDLFEKPDIRLSEIQSVLRMTGGAK